MPDKRFEQADPREELRQHRLRSLDERIFAARKRAVERASVEERDDRTTEAKAWEVPVGLYTIEPEPEQPSAVASG